MFDAEEYRKKTGMTSTDMAERIALMAPKFDRYLLSKTERPDEYGVQLVPYIADTLSREAGITGAKSDGHKLTHRLSVRLTKQRFEELQRVKTDLGIYTNQEFLNLIFMKFLVWWDKEKEQAL